MSFLETLSGDDPRSLGRTDQVIQAVLNDHRRLGELYDCLFVDDETIRMRAGDALEKVCRVQPDWLKPFVERLFDEVSKINQPSVQWHVAQMLCEVELDAGQTKRALKLLKHNLRTIDDWIVTNVSIQSLEHFTRSGTLDPIEFVKLLKSQQNNRHNSVKARVRKLLAEFETA